MTNEQLLKALTPPSGVVDAVIDTDTYNEIDDQFALSYMIRSDDKINLKAIYAAPFFNQHSTSPKDGMEKSYNEIFNILTLMKEEELKKVVYRGSEQYLPRSRAFMQACFGIHYRKSTLRRSHRRYN